MYVDFLYVLLSVLSSVCSSVCILFCLLRPYDYFFCKCVCLSVRLYSFLFTSVCLFVRLSSLYVGLSIYITVPLCHNDMFIENTQNKALNNKVFIQNLARVVIEKMPRFENYQCVLNCLCIQKSKETVEIQYIFLYLDISMEQKSRRGFMIYNLSLFNL